MGVCYSVFPECLKHSVVNVLYKERSCCSQGEPCPSFVLTSVLKEDWELVDYTNKVDFGITVYVCCHKSFWDAGGAPFLVLCVRGCCNNNY